MHLAVLADIHGNWRAVDAVLADITRRGVDRIINLGDSLYGPFDPAHVADRLLAAGWPTVSGNEDRCLVEAADGAPASRVARFTLDRLDTEHIAWLRALPQTQTIDRIAFAFHGSPTNDARYLLHEPQQDGSMRPREPKEIAADLRGIDASLILCAHDHIPRVVELRDGRTVINPGSVGCPAYTDDQPILHRVENGSPHARYAVVGPIADSPMHIELFSIPYDWDAAAVEAEAHGFAEWEMWLRTGCVR